MGRTNLQYRKYKPKASSASTSSSSSLSSGASTRKETPKLASNAFRYADYEQALEGNVQLQEDEEDQVWKHTGGLESNEDTIQMKKVKEWETPEEGNGLTLDYTDLARAFQQVSCHELLQLDQEYVQLLTKAPSSLLIPLPEAPQSTQEVETKELDQLLSLTTPAPTTTTTNIPSDLTLDPSPATEDLQDWLDDVLDM